MPNLFRESSKNKLALSWETRPFAPAKRIEPDAICDKYELFETYRLVVEAMEETVRAVDEAYGKATFPAPKITGWLPVVLIERVELALIR